MTEILSPNMYKGRIAKIRLTVIHTMEVDENSLSVAEAVAKAFLNPARKASAHSCIDQDSEVICVHDENTAWAAPGANADGLQQELAGRAGQTSGDWTDVASQRILERSAQRTAIWAKKWSIPVKHLSVAEIRAGHSGIVGHVDITMAYGKSTHWDPGPNFPWTWYLNRVREIMGNGATPAPTPVVAATKAEEEFDMDEFIKVFYRNILGRAAGQAEIDARMLDTAANGTTIHQHYLSILMSDESEARSAQVAYATGLGRKPSNAEIKWWVDAAQGPDAVRAGILGSAEAKAFAALTPAVRAAAIAAAMP